MCGRYTLFTGDEDLGALFGIELVQGDHLPTYNQAPAQMVRVVIGSTITLMKWGLVPAWAKPGFKPLINARSETVTEKPSFRSAAKQRRCLIPTNGYYEWANKQPYFLSLGEQTPVLAMAGIYEGDTCAVLTREATAELAHIHSRMPLFVPKYLWNAWLDPASGDVAELIEEIPPAPLVARKASAAVGNVANDFPELIRSL